MNKSTKIKIAKEVIILFSSTVIIGLIWIIFWSINKININKTEKLQNKITLLKQDIDSIQSSTSNIKIKTFKELLTGVLPLVYLEFEAKHIPPPPDIEQGDLQTKNIGELYSFLATTKFLYSNDSVVPEFPSFKIDIAKELDFLNKKNNFEVDSSKQVHLRKIYAFLKNHNYLSVNYKEFVCTIDFYMLLPDISNSVAKRKEKEKLNNEFYQAKVKIYSNDDLQELVKYISIIILILVYPFRFLFFLLKWAIKTLKQKQS